MGEATNLADAEVAAPAPARRRSRARRPLPTNVIPLHQRIMPRHVELLARWLEAGRMMGLCDASTFKAERSGQLEAVRASEYVLVWVRENIDPAYLIRPERIGWTVIDAVRDNELGRTSSFGAALQLIRPVLKAAEAA